MPVRATNFHGTAVMLGTRGILFVGPSGIGKSMMAFQCLGIARRRGFASALVCDDQVLLHGEEARVIATCPSSIAGLLELRGSGIIRMDHVEQADLDLVVQVVCLADADRLPPEQERWRPAEDIDLPLVRIANTAPDPLLVIGGVMAEWRSDPLFW